MTASRPFWIRLCGGVTHTPTNTVRLWGKQDLGLLCSLFLKRFDGSRDFSPKVQSEKKVKRMWHIVVLFRTSLYLRICCFWLLGIAFRRVLMVPVSFLMFFQKSGKWKSCEKTVTQCRKFPYFSVPWESGVFDSFDLAFGWTVTWPYAGKSGLGSHEF